MSGYQLTPADLEALAWWALVANVVGTVDAGPSAGTVSVPITHGDASTNEHPVGVNVVPGDVEGTDRLARKRAKL